MNAASIDFRHAYKNVGISPGQEEFSSILLASPSGPLLVARLRAQPFGSSLAPANWGRVTALLKWVFLRLFGVVLAVFVDDCYLAEPSAAIGSAYTFVCEVIRNCGFELGPVRRVYHRFQSRYSGLRFHFLKILRRLPFRRIAGAIS